MTAHNFMGKNKPYPINSTNICNATTRPINQMGEEKGQKFFRKKTKALRQTAILLNWKKINDFKQKMPEAHQQSSFSNMFDKPLIKDCIWRNDHKKGWKYFSLFFQGNKT